MTKILLSVFSVLILIFGALLIIPSFIDWSQYKDEIKSQVEKATGYQLDLNGELRAAFLPTPHVNISNVAIDSGSAEGAFAFQGQVEKASVDLALLPLLGGNIQVSDVTLLSPQVTVRQQENTKVAEVTPTEQTEKKQSSANVKIDRFYTENAKISYKPTDGDMMIFEFPKMELQADSIFGPYTINGRVKYQDFDLGVDGNVGEYTEDKPLPIKVNIDGGAYQLNYNGIADMTKADPEAQGEFKIQTSSLAKLAAQFGSKDLPIKDQSMTLSGMLAASAKSARLDNGQLNLGNVKTAMPVKFNYGLEQKSGTFALSSLPGGGMVDLDINMAGNDPRIGGQIHLENLKALLVDVLGVVEAKTFENPQVPNTAKGDIKTILGDTIILNSNDLTLGQYKLNNTKLNYTAGDTPKIDLAIGSFEGASIKASGILDATQGINVNVSHPNAAKFIKVFNKEFQSSPNLEKPFSFIGKIFMDGDTIRVNGMDAKIGSIDANGNLVINNGGEIPSIKADLAFGNLDTQALVTGKTSQATDGKNAGASASTAAPWTRDAIDTDFLRGMNLDITAKANQLIHGTWVISNPEIDVDLNNGVLDINKIAGGLFEGTVNMSGKLSAKSAGQPLSVSSKISAQNVDLTKLVKAALSQNKDRVVGKGNFNIDLSTTGLSSSALVYGLNGDGKITTNDLIIKGIDLDKITETIADESLTDLATVVRSAFNDGQTSFKAVDFPLTIREGTLAVNNWTLVSPTANIIANGDVSFARWAMNLNNKIDFTNPDDLPTLEMSIKGPLNAPQQNVASDILTSFIKNKYGAKIKQELGKQVDKLLGDKLKDSPAKDLINNFLGVPKATTTTPTVEPTTTTPEPAANDNVEPAIEEPAPQQSPEEQIIKGLFDQFGK